MNVTIDLQAKINDCLAERRSMGFKLDNMGAALANFARFAANRSHQGPLTTTLMADTTEAIFGLPPMSQWDENASVLSGMWTDHPDYAETKLLPMQVPVAFNVGQCDDYTPMRRETGASGHPLHPNSKWYAWYKARQTQRGAGLPPPGKGGGLHAHDPAQGAGF
ncbi:MAG: hypothetical protein ACYCUY_05870 [Acidithiobacillus sp.]